MDALMAARQQIKAAAAEAGLPKFTLMPLIVRATSLALLRFPELNASISKGEYIWLCMYLCVHLWIYTYPHLSMLSSR